MREVNGQVTDLNPGNDPILWDLMTYANERMQDSIKEISQQYSVSNKSRLDYHNDQVCKLSFLTVARIECE